jgi:hypothetical protein
MDNSNNEVTPANTTPANFFTGTNISQKEAKDIKDYADNVSLVAKAKANEKVIKNSKQNEELKTQLLDQIITSQPEVLKTRNNLEKARNITTKLINLISSDVDNLGDYDTETRKSLTFELKAILDNSSAIEDVEKTLVDGQLKILKIVGDINKQEIAIAKNSNQPQQTVNTLHIGDQYSVAIGNMFKGLDDYT